MTCEGAAACIAAGREKMSDDNDMEKRVTSVRGAGCGGGIWGWGWVGGHITALHITNDVVMRR